MWTIKCGECDHEGEAGTFFTRHDGTYFTPGQFQCPRCNVSWKYVYEGKATLTESGLVIPPEKRMVYLHTNLRMVQQRLFS